MDKITIGVIFIFLPGILALMVSEKLTSHPKREGYELLAFTFVLGCLSHLLYFIFYASLKRFDVLLPEDKWLDLMSTTSTAAQPSVVLYTTTLGVVLGFILSYARNYSWLHRFAVRIKASRKIGDVDLWAYLFNSTLLEEDEPWVVVRDREKKLMYQGMVHTFSDVEDTRELILKYVRVFDNETADNLYDVEIMYLSFEKKNASIEIYKKE